MSTLYCTKIDSLKIVSFLHMYVCGIGLCPVILSLKHLETAQKTEMGYNNKRNKFSKAVSLVRHNQLYDRIWSYRFFWLWQFYLTACGLGDWVPYLSVVKLTSKSREDMAGCSLTQPKANNKSEIAAPFTCRNNLS